MAVAWVDKELVDQVLAVEEVEEQSVEEAMEVEEVAVEEDLSNNRVMMTKKMMDKW